MHKKAALAVFSLVLAAGPLHVAMGMRNYNYFWTEPKTKPKGMQELVWTIKHGLLESVKKALEQEPVISTSKQKIDKPGNRTFDINTPDESGRTILHYACDTSHLNIVMFLVEKQADITKEGNGWTPLLLACHQKNLALLKFLVRKGASVTQEITGTGVLPRGTTPLLMAYVQSHQEAINFLVAHGTPITPALAEEFPELTTQIPYGCTMIGTFYSDKESFEKHLTVLHHVALEQLKKTAQEHKCAEALEQIEKWQLSATPPQQTGHQFF